MDLDRKKFVQATVTEKIDKLFIVSRKKVKTYFHRQEF